MADEPGSPWRIWADTGGTFTDCIGVDPAGRVCRAKVLSTSALRGRVVEQVSGRTLRVQHDWAEDAASRGLLDLAVAGMNFRRLDAEDGVVTTVARASQGATVLELAAELDETVSAGTIFELNADEEAPILGARLLTGTPPGGELPLIAMRLGTTRGTNALLERRGGPVALFTTRGFADLLEIGTQQRPDLFALEHHKPALLHDAVVEVAGRLGADGAELEELDLEAVAAEAHRLVSRGIRSAAIALMHSWRNPHHEREVAAMLARAGFEHGSRSSDLAPLIRILPRTQTTVVNAYLAEVMEDYIARVQAALAAGMGDTGLHLMTSSGGLVRAREFRPKDSLLSGPAGGVVGAAAAGAAAGYTKTIAFDMGGTSTDVSRFDGDYQYVFEHEVGDAKIVAPALAIHTVAAGGGSVCWIDRGALRVGPQSAGAHPGPACHGAGGPLTITDCNLLLGRLDPHCFGIPVLEGPARAKLKEAAAHIAEQSGRTIHPDELAEGFLEIACERMAEAIARISIRQGHDAADYALVAFGGAGGQHACAVARRLGIARIVLPRDAGLLSAAGLGMAAIERIAQRQVLRAASDVDLEALLKELADDATGLVRQEGVRHVVIRRQLLEMRLEGQESTITVEHPVGAVSDSVIAGFKQRYVQLYGHEPPERTIEIESARVIAGSDRDEGLLVGDAETLHARGPRVVPSRQRSACIGGRWQDVPVIHRAELAADEVVRGPAIIVEAHSTAVVEPGWLMQVHSSGALVLERVAESAPSVAAQAPRAVRDEVAVGRLLAIAGDMGEMLQRTALSTNVKERLDFSCAILDAAGRLIVNAPHVPVHLGSLGVCVRALLETISIEPGDVIITNDPAVGGSHLPDITVVTPVHDASGVLRAFVASRAHHAEIGGISPGSMPTSARSLAEEGVVIRPMHLVRAGRARWGAVERVLSAGRWPSRAVQENLADLRAQVAANQHGVRALRDFPGGSEELHRGMTILLERAAAGTARALRQLAERGSTFEAIEKLDDGSPICVRIEIGGERERIDFADSAPVHPGNLNATPAIVRSAVIYVLRLLVNEPLPLNEGLLSGIDIVLPEGMLAPPFDADPARSPAVAGGNVETSQRIVDTLLKALELCACSQGTMNNIIFGTERYGYYETVCGGAGAGPGYAGASALHTHMTNTRITDPEIIEHRYPVRLERFAVRRGSGGSGRFAGGDGVIRQLEFLEACELSIISQHRATGPYGMAGGGDGEPGRQWVVHRDGHITPLRGIDTVAIRPGDRLILESPGGGAWGPP